MRKNILLFSALVGLSASVAGSAIAGDWGKAGQVSTTNSILRSSKDRQAETRDAVNDVRTEVRESSLNQIEAMKAQNAELVSYLDKQIVANERITDAAELNETERLRQEMRARYESGELDPNPGACFLLDLFRGGNGSTMETGKKAFGSQTASKARLAGDGADPDVLQGPTSVSRGITDDVVALRGALGYDDATTNPASIFENVTLPTNNGDAAKNAAALERLMRNMVDPFPQQPVTASELRDPAGQARQAAREVEKTRQNTGAEVLAMTMNMRDPIGEVNSGHIEYAKKIAGYNRNLTEGDDISELQLIEIRNLRQYAPSGEFQTERETYNQTSYLHDILDQLAVLTRIQYLQLELDTRNAAVNTQILSALVNGNGPR